MSTLNKSETEMLLYSEGVLKNLLAGKIDLQDQKARKAAVKAVANLHTVITMKGHYPK